MINRLTGNESPVQILPKRDWDSSGSRFGSVAKSKEKLGFEALIDIEEGLTKTVEWTLQNLPFIEACIEKHAEPMAAYS
jgi:nucleoside-diphosphate-sugar epimerase